MFSLTDFNSNNNNNNSNNNKKKHVVLSISFQQNLKSVLLQKTPLIQIFAWDLLLVLLFSHFCISSWPPSHLSCLHSDRCCHLWHSSAQRWWNRSCGAAKCLSALLMLSSQDYWFSLVFKRLVGPKVLAVRVAGLQRKPQPGRVIRDKLRIYAHCTSYSKYIQQLITL